MARSSWLVAILITWSGSFAQEVHIPLNDGWRFQQVGKEQWYSAEVPGVVQTDLLRHGLIPDFMLGSNIDSVQWIENEDWTYMRTILVTDTLLKHRHLDLVFKGLDTFAEVYINDSLIGKADNMFRTWEWPIKSLLRPGPNELKVIFRSPIKEGAKLRDAYRVQLPHDNDPTGVSPYIRKAAYQFGWDFCPRLVTSGIWQEVELRGWSKARISNIWIAPQQDDSWVPYVQPITQLAADIGRSANFRYDVWIDGSLIAGSVRLRKANNRLLGLMQDQWWPNGLGAHSVHEIRMVMLDDGKPLSEATRTWARRSIDWSWESDYTSFTCSVNDTPVFMKGCNLVPPSLILTGGMDSAWVAQVRHMQAAGMNMVRVWAGGVYPPDAFYHACDTAGILVWLDLMVANMLPADGLFEQGMYNEVQEQAYRALEHPSTALICGNNELRVAWHNWGWQDRYGLHGRDSSVVIYSNERLWTGSFAEWLKYEGYKNYQPTSPVSNWGNKEGLRSGDLHYWGVWHGDSTFSSFKNNVGRFVSEYGFQSYPDSALLAKYLDPKELYLGSPAMKRLQRSYKTDRPIWEAMERELGEKPTTLDGFIEGSQCAQALAYEMAIKAHMNAQPHCMGTLLWQLNDCWPGPSWSIIDYAGKPKPAYHVVKRLYTGQD